MHREDQLRLAERVLGLIEAGTTDMAPAPYERDVAAYHDPSRLELEREVVFRRTPLFAGLSLDLRQPGDFLRHGATGVPLLVVRQDDGSVAAYLNICRHRGTQLVEAAQGSCRTFSCPYHGWSYDRGGRLIGVPFRHCFGDVEPSERSLQPMPVAEKFGMIFVCGTPGAAIDLDAHLGPLGPELERWRVGEFVPACRRTLEARVNWKLALDTYAEGYHFSVLHRDTIARLSHTNVMAYDHFAPHYRLCFPTLLMKELRALPREEWEPLDYMSLVYYIYPNLSLNVTGTRARTVRTFLIAPGDDVRSSTTLHAAYTERPLGDDAARAEFKRHFDYMHGVIQDEDYAVGVGVQDGILSGVPMTFLFGRNEPSLIDMHRQHDRVMAEAKAARRCADAHAMV